MSLQSSHTGLWGGRLVLGFLYGQGRGWLFCLFLNRKREIVEDSAGQWGITKRKIGHLGQTKIHVSWIDPSLVCTAEVCFQIARPIPLALSLTNWSLDSASSPSFPYSKAWFVVHPLQVAWQLVVWVIPQHSCGYCPAWVFCVSIRTEASVTVMWYLLIYLSTPTSCTLQILPESVISQSHLI